MILSEILIVDDSEILDIVWKMISGDAFVKLEASSFETAVSKIRVNKVDVIILSGELRSENGYVLCKRLRSYPTVKEIPIIMVIPTSDRKKIQLAMEAGATDYLLSPFSNEELLMRINLHLNLKKTKENAETTVKTKAMLLANISHEIRTPLNGIIGMTDILKQTELISEQLEYLEIIRLSGENLLMLINDVLDFSKIEAGQITFERIRFNLIDIVNEVIKILSFKAEQKKLEFTAQFSPEIPDLVIGDPLRLKQILINLCSNAIKFTPRGSVKIKINLQKAEKTIARLFFEVEDSGIGISEESQAKLFQTFAQAENSITRKFGGTGLGLAICRNLVELMNGEIGVYSELGKGSNFYFNAEFGLPDEEGGNITKSGNGRKLKILLAEDNIINQKVAILNLEKLGHTVALANDGKEAIDKYHNETPDVILMDIQMSGMDGLEATRKIREWEKANKTEKPVPIVAMTAHTLESDKELFIGSGMNDFLYKPFNWNDLVNVLDRISTLVEAKIKT